MKSRYFFVLFCKKLCNKDNFVNTFQFEINTNIKENKYKIISNIGYLLIKQKHGYVYFYFLWQIHGIHGMANVSKNENYKIDAKDW